MLRQRSDIRTESVLEDDTQLINDQMTKAKQKIVRALCYILAIEIIWTWILLKARTYSSPFDMNCVPVIIAAILVYANLRQNKLKGLRIAAKVMYYYTLLRSLILIALVLLCVLEPTDLSRFIRISSYYIIELIAVSGINAIVEFITVYFALRVLKFTNQYILLAKRRMSRVVNEDEVLAMLR